MKLYFAYLRLLPIFLLLLLASASAVTRSYYIAAEDINWDYAPQVGIDVTMGMPYNEEQREFVVPSETRIGSIYKKIRYVGYIDGSFEKMAPVEDQSLGILGPVIRAEVGDSISITFRNMASRPASIHAHGVFYSKAHEGVVHHNDGTSATAGSFVEPGSTFVYQWSVPERAGPGPGDGSSIVWLYHSHVDEIKDVNTGLFGPIVITKRGFAIPQDGSPSDVDAEIFIMMMVMNENESLFFDEMVSELANPQQLDLEEDDEFEESNLMHAINGFVFGNLPMPSMQIGQRVRWYVMSLGSEVDLHTPHWHGNTIVSYGHRRDVVEILPGVSIVADMVPDNAGIWMLHCHVNDHIAAGMTARYEVLANDVVVPVQSGYE